MSEPSENEFSGEEEEDPLLVGQRQRTLDPKEAEEAAEEFRQLQQAVAVAQEAAKEEAAASNEASERSVLAALDEVCKVHDKDSNTVRGYRAKLKRYLQWIHDNKYARPFTRAQIVLVYLMTVIKEEGTKRRDGTMKALTANVLSANLKG